MKRAWEYIRTFLFLAVAAWLAVDLTTKYQSVLTQIANFVGVDPKYLLDARFILPFMTPLIYFVEQMIYQFLSRIPWMYRIPLIGWFFDNKAMFVGTYLSLPFEKDELNVFRIKFDAANGKYKLNGYAYSLSKGTVIGHWDSEKLDMKTSEPVALSYIYDGRRGTGSPVRGLVDITFDGDKPNKSQNGYWLDVDVAAKSERKLSHYLKVTPRIKKKIIPWPVFLDRDFPFLFIRRFVSKPATIFKACRKNRGVLDKDAEFERPT